MKPSDTRDAPRLAARFHALKRAVVGLIVAMVALLAIGATAAALPVGAAESANIIDIVGFAASYMAVLLVLFLILLVVTAVAWKGLKMQHRAIMAVLVSLTFGLVAIGAMQPVTPSGDDGDGGDFVPEWEIILQGTRSTARDVASEIFDTQGGTGGGGETPTATLCAYATNALLDIANRKLVHQQTIDDDVTTGTAGFSAPDICSFDFSFRLTNPVDQNGDGVQDSISIFGRLRSISATTSEDGNGTSTRRNLFMWDTTFGWYLGFSRDVDTINTDGQWISVAPAGASDGVLPTSFDWQNLGVNAGADEDYATFAYIYRNYGPYGYTLPAAGFTYSMMIDIGTPASYVTVEVITQLSARA